MDYYAQFKAVADKVAQNEPVSVQTPAEGNLNPLKP